MCKRITVGLLLILAFLNVHSQYRDEQKGWNSNNVFIGTGLNLGFSNGFIIGLNPEFGYSINKVVDAGFVFNVTHITQRDQYVNSTARYTAVGVGPFVRLWPIQQLFIGGQFEYNKISYSEKTTAGVINRAKATAPSLLAGLGYGTRNIGQMQIYTSIMIDLLRDVNSPYRDQFGRVMPVFRTGFSFYLGRNKNN